MLTFLTTLIATAWTAFVIDAVIETDRATEQIRAVGRVLQIPPSNAIWLAAAAGATVILLWVLAVWLFAGRRARRRASRVAGTGARATDGGFIDPPALPLHGYLGGRETIELNRLTSMQDRITELQERVRTLSADRAHLRDEARRLRRDLGIPEPPPQWTSAVDETGELAAAGDTGAVDVPIVLSAARRSAPSPSRSRP